MKRFVLSSALFLTISSSVNIAHAADTLTTAEAASAIKWEVGLISAGALYLGIDSWNWDVNNSFKFNDEGWFDLDTGSAGADKLGHMYSSYLINELFNKRLNQKTDNKLAAARKSALFSSAIMFGVEIFDGYSDDHGFSYEDLIMNTAGIGVSYLKNTVPGLDDKLDLRVEYEPTDSNNNHPITNYSAYTYVAALRLGGFQKLKTTPLKYFELQLGYHTEGFKSSQKDEFPEAKTELRFGVGLDLSELIFKPLDRNEDNALLQAMDTFTRYYRLPYTSTSTVIDERVR
jgi:hypothetical protein